MYQGIVKAGQELREKRQQVSESGKSEERLLSQTDLINKTNVEVAKHLIRFMHEYLTSVEIKNLPENLAKTDDIRDMLKSLDDLIVSQAVSTNDLAESINSGIEDLIMAVDELRSTSADKTEDGQMFEQVCSELRNVQTAIADANKAVLKGDKSQTIVSAVKALEKAVKGLEMAPVVNVAPADVDLSGIEQAIAEIPSKIVIPKTVIPKPDYSALEEAVKAVQASIDNLVFPVAEFPTTVTVKNPDGSSIGSLADSNTLAGSNAAQKDTTYYGDGVISGIAAVGIRYFDGAAWNRTPAVKLLWDDTTTANTIYVGKAPIGTATSAGSWQIQKINTSTKDIKYAASGAFTATWDNRATSETYS